MIIRDNDRGGGGTSTILQRSKLLVCDVCKRTPVCVGGGAPQEVAMFIFKTG